MKIVIDANKLKWYKLSMDTKTGKAIMIRVSDEMHREIKIKSAESGKSIQEIVLDLIKDFLRGSK
jgi:predicted HicB family RNase H-like nuclease